MTFSASAAVGEAFIVTAEYHENRGTSSTTEYAYNSANIGIKDKEQIKVTYTLL